MIENLLLVAGNVLTLFLMMGVGYYFARKQWFGAVTQKELTQVLLYAVTPCLIINSMPEERNAETLRIFGVAGGILLVSYVLMVLLSQLFFAGQPENSRAPLRFGIVYGNVGFMGLPLLEAVLGPEALLYGVICMVVFNLVNWTHGISLMGGKGNASVKKALLNPGMIGFVLGFLLYLTGITLPSPVSRAMGYIGGLNTPLAMLIIGAQMASTKLSEIFRDTRLYLVSFVRLFVIPILTMLALMPFKLDRLMVLALVILAGCPVGGTTSIFSQQFGRDTKLAAEEIAQSTTLSIISLPIVAALAQYLIK